MDRLFTEFFLPAIVGAIIVFAVYWLLRWIFPSFDEHEQKQSAQIAEFSEKVRATETIEELSEIVKSDFFPRDKPEA